MDLKMQEQEVLKRWRAMRLLETLQAQNKDGEPYFLLDGPPYANNVPHAGHLRIVIYKDIMIRHAFMQGRNVLFQPGFDTHGLPIENMVERSLKLTSKKDIESMGIAKFAAACKASATQNKDLWLTMFERLGSWYSWKQPYLTYENTYMESCWNAFKTIWDKGMVYEGVRPVHWCPHCQTALAGYEASDSYKNVSDPGVYVLFKRKDLDEYFLVFTTTPWTLPSNVGLVVHPEEEYVRAKTTKDGKEHAIVLAKKRVPMVKEWGLDVTITDTFKGNTLDGVQYEPLFDVKAQRVIAGNPKAHRIYLSIPLLKERVASKVALKKGIKAGDLFEHFVTAEEGTGIVHCAPGHGKTDYEIGMHYGMPPVCPLTDECTFTDDVGPWAGQFVKDADHPIADSLHKTGTLLHYERIDHAYPLCWRCKSPLIFKLSQQWFIKIEPIKERMLEIVESTHWMPEFAKERMNAWILNAEDWNISRQRYWGTPIPIWQCTCGKNIAIGTVVELEKAAGKKLTGFDLHAASDLELECSCSKTMRRVPEIFDVWFDAGCAPFASMHYPFENKEQFERHYPVNRISESQDQIRGWFYYLLFCGTAYLGEQPFKELSMPGWVVDEKGEKMSKSLGNFLGAQDLLEKYGADILRYYACWDIAPHALQKYSTTTIENEVVKFFIIMANLTKLTVSGAPEAKATEDRWLLSRLHSTLSTLLKSYAQFTFHEGMRAIADFVMNDLSRTYVQFTRERMEDDDNPRRLIGHALVLLGRAIAPVTPFLSEQLYQLDAAKPSVHLERLPDVEAQRINENLEKRMALVQNIISAALSARDKVKLGVRWSIGELLIDTNDTALKDAIQELAPLVKSQVNAKAITFTSIPVRYEVKPDYKALGKQFGQQTADVLALLNQNEDAVQQQVAREAPIITVGPFAIPRDGLTITRSAAEKTTTLVETPSALVAINTHMNQTLLAEGYARELTRRVQQIRKNLGLQRSDRVMLSITADDAELIGAIEPHLQNARARMGASEITITQGTGTGDPFTVRGRSFWIDVKHKA